MVEACIQCWQEIMKGFCGFRHEMHKQSLCCAWSLFYKARRCPSESAEAAHDGDLLTRGVRVKAQQRFWFLQGPSDRGCQGQRRQGRQKQAEQGLIVLGPILGKLSRWHMMCLRSFRVNQEVTRCNAVLAENRIFESV